ncbi:MAG: redoxin domain-containing protein [Bacteroidia bacterium]
MFSVPPWFIILLIYNLASCNSKPFQNLKGEETSIEIKKNTKAIVYFFLVPDCPFSQLYSMAVNQVHSVYSSKGFQFYGIVPGNLYKISEIDSFITTHDFLPEILIDQKYNFSKKYKVTVVPQVVVTDTKGQVLYSGKLDDQAIQPGQKKYQPTKFYLLDALKNISEGKEVGVKNTKAVGCYIE